MAVNASRAIFRLAGLKRTAGPFPGRVDLRCMPPVPASRLGPLQIRAPSRSPARHSKPAGRQTCQRNPQPARTVFPGDTCLSRRKPVPDRSHLRSASALSIALGLAAAPLGAQPADTPAGLLNTYPALSSIEDRSCLNILAEYEARAGSGALEPVIEGEIAPEAVESAEEDLLRCLRVASDAGETEAPVEDRDEPVAAEAAEAAPMAEEPVAPPEPEAEIAEPSPSAEAPAEPATGSAGTEAQAEAETEAESETDMPADAEPETTESGPSEAAEGGQETVADAMPEPAEDEAGEIVEEAEVQPEEDMLAEALAETAGP